MHSKFASENFKTLCRKINNLSLDKKARAEMLREAFVWSDAPRGKYYWHGEWTRLTKGQELTQEAHRIVKQMGEGRSSELTSVPNKFDLCERFGLEW